MRGFKEVFSVSKYMIVVPFKIWRTWSEVNKLSHFVFMFDIDLRKSVNYMPRWNVVCGLTLRLANFRNSLNIRPEKLTFPSDNMRKKCLLSSFENKIVLDRI